MITMTKEEYDNYYNVKNDNYVKLKKLTEHKKDALLSPVEDLKYINNINTLISVINDTASNKDKILNTIKHCNWKFNIITYAIVGNWEDILITFTEREILNPMDISIDSLKNLKIKDFRLTDKNNNKLEAGDIINIHQTVNGENLFIIDSIIEPIRVRYCRDLSTIYEYDVNDLLEVDVLNADKEIEKIGNIYDYINSLR